MTIMLDGSGLTIEKLVRIGRFGEEVGLAPVCSRTDQSLPQHA